MIKEADQDRWLTLATTQIPVQLIAELSRRAGTTPARSIRLDVLVEQLHRVELGAVAGQNVQLDPLGVASNPGADQLGPVHGMAIHDQVDLAPAAIDPGSR
jgi:hypothetical protein